MAILFSGGVEGGSILSVAGVSPDFLSAISLESSSQDSIAAIPGAFPKSCVLAQLLSLLLR